MCLKSKVYPINAQKRLAPSRGAVRSGQRRSEMSENPTFAPVNAPQFTARWRGWEVRAARPHPTIPMIAAPLPQESVSAITSLHRSLPQFSDVTRPPPPHPNPGIATWCQSHTSTRRSDRSRTDHGSSIRARLRLADMRRQRNCPAQNTRNADTYGKPTRKPKRCRGNGN